MTSDARMITGSDRSDHRIGSICNASLWSPKSIFFGASDRIRWPANGSTGRPPWHRQKNRIGTSTCSGERYARSMKVCRKRQRSHLPLTQINGRFSAAANSTTGGCHAIKPSALHQNVGRVVQRTASAMVASASSLRLSCVA